MTGPLVQIRRARELLQQARPNPIGRTLNEIIDAHLRDAERALEARKEAAE